MKVKIIRSSSASSLEVQTNEFLSENMITDADIKLSVGGTSGTSIEYVVLIQY